MTDMDAMEALRTRSSCRSYDPDRVVEWDLILQIVDAGRLAATARNIQPWEFVIVTEQDIRRKLAEISDYGKFIADAPVCVVVFCEDGKYYLEDGSAATQNMLVAATALGIGSCWVAGDKKPYAGKIGDLLDVPRTHKLVSMISLGHGKETAGRAPKRSLEEVLHRDRY